MQRFYLWWRTSASISQFPFVLMPCTTILLLLQERSNRYHDIHDHRTNDTAINCKVLLSFGVFLNTSLETTVTPKAHGLVILYQYLNIMHLYVYSAYDKKAQWKRNEFLLERSLDSDAFFCFPVH